MAAACASSVATATPITSQWNASTKTRSSAMFITVAAVMAARARGMHVALLSGGTGGKLRPLCDVSVVVGASETFMVQELHLPVYHALCLMLEYAFFPPRP